MNKNELAHYSPEDVTIIVAGMTITGFVSGTFVEISKDSPIFKSRESADGVVARSHSVSKLYKVNISLASTSDSNQLLTYLATLDSVTKIAKFPIIIKDQLGQSLFFSPESWIDTIPDSEFSESVETRSWNITCANAVMNVGGNYDSSGLIGDVLNIGAGYLSGVV